MCKMSKKSDEIKVVQYCSRFVQIQSPHCIENQSQGISLSIAHNCVVSVHSALKTSFAKLNC
jgi:hypothetical protein